MKEQKVYNIAGLDTYTDVFSSAPEGSLSKAENVVIDQVNLLSPRRGFEKLTTDVSDGTTITFTDDQKLFYFKETVHLQTLAGVVYYYDETNLWWVKYTESLIAPLETNRSRFVEASQNTYVTSSLGVQKIEDLGTPILDAGVGEAFTPSISSWGTGGPYEPDYSGAYRVVWGYRDANQNVVLGPPSQRLVATSDAAGPAFAHPVLNIKTPIDAKNTWFYQVYRSTLVDQSVVTTDPGDELSLIYEENITDSILATGYVEYSEVVTAQLGVPLYTNATQEGLAASNFQPPNCKDLGLFQGYTFYANTTRKHEATLQLYGTGSSGLVQNDGLLIDDLSFDAQYVDFSIDGTFTNSSTTVTVDNTAGLYVGMVFPTVTGLPFAVDVASIDSATQFTMTGTSGFAGTSELAFTSTLSNIGRDGSAGLPYLYGITSKSAISEGSSVSISGDLELTLRSLATSINEESTLDITALYQEDGIGKIRLIENDYNLTSTTGFNIQGSGRDVAGTWSPTLSFFEGIGTFVTGSNIVTAISDTTNIRVGDLITSEVIPLGTTVTSVLSSTSVEISGISNSTTPFGLVTGQFKAIGETKPNRIYYSKLQEPEAVPLANYFDVGPANSRIKRIVPLRTSLLIFTEREIYKLSGTTEAAFQVNLIDNTIRIKAEDSLVVFNNKVYGLFDQGVCEVGDYVRVLSRPVEGELLEIFGATGSALNTLSFGISYESDRKYILWVPSTAQSTVADKAYVYNAVTQTWTTWLKNAGNGIMHKVQDKMFLVSGDLGSKERKDFDAQDIADEQIEADVTIVSGTTLTVGAGTTAASEIGYMYYESPAKFSRITAIDTNAGTITVQDDLAWDLSTFSITADLTEFSATLENIVTSVDIAVNAEITGTNISADKTKVISLSEDEVTLNRSVTGTATTQTLTVSQKYQILPTIPIEVEWNPFHMGSPGVLKQFMEATLITTNALSDVTFGFKGVSSGSFEDIEFSVAAIGYWGLFPWGGAAFGGDPAVLRYRTYIPKEKQRDSAIFPRIKMDTIFNNFEVSGISMIYRTLSSRTVR